MSAPETISREEFERRLIAMCERGGEGVPKKIRDRHILLAAASLWMKEGQVYTEREVNHHLEHWASSICPRARLDSVTLRREMVDASYLMRDDAGTSYTAGPGSSLAFDPGVAHVDPEGLILGARSDRALRKAAHMDRSDEQP